MAFALSATDELSATQAAWGLSACLLPLNAQADSTYFLFAAAITVGARNVDWYARPRQAMLDRDTDAGRLFKHAAVDRERRASRPRGRRRLYHRGGCRNAAPRLPPHRARL